MHQIMQGSPFAPAFDRALEGRVALVTGGGQGLGAEACKALAVAGATVVVSDVQLESARRTAAAIEQAGGRPLAVRLDVGDDTDVRRAIDETVERHGRLDAVVNNAGIDFTLPVGELGVDQWDAVIRTNLRGPFLVSKYASRHMCSRRSGHIINVASTAAKRAWPNASAYHASKWGLLGLSHALHAELRPHNVKVSAVIAGGMRTPFLLDRFPDLDPEVLQDPGNVARTIVFLLLLPTETVIPEVMVIPMRESSWP